VREEEVVGYGKGWDWEGESKMAGGGGGGGGKRRMAGKGSHFPPSDAGWA